MSAWPAPLPEPQFRGFALTPGRRGRRFEVDVGPAKQGMTTTAARSRVVLVYKCTQTEADTILDFHADPNGGAGGGAWFAFTQPFKRTTVNAMFVIGSEPAVAENAPYFMVTVTLEVDAW